jgi:hypothetical protein
MIESLLNSDVHQCNQYKQNEQPPVTWNHW